ncbi:MAG: lysophospholipid acyltransferase family protein [Clostridia bacterium]
MPNKKVPLIYSFAKSVLSFYCKIVYKAKYIGTENIPTTGAVILVSSHVTALDPMMLGGACPRQVHFMAKDSLFKNKIAGYFIRKVGTFPVVRGTGGEDALQNAYDILSDQKVVGIFFEGTRSKDGELLRPKTGASLVAYKTRATVVPVSIIGKDGKIPQKHKGTVVNIGKPIPFEDLNMSDESSMHYRRGAKVIMGEVARLRQEAIDMMEVDS